MRRIGHVALTVSVMTWNMLAVLHLQALLGRKNEGGWRNACAFHHRCRRRWPARRRGTRAAVGCRRPRPALAAASASIGLRTLPRHGARQPSASGVAAYHEAVPKPPYYAASRLGGPAAGPIVPSSRAGAGKRAASGRTESTMSGETRSCARRVGPTMASEPRSTRPARAGAVPIERSRLHERPHQVPFQPSMSSTDVERAVLSATALSAMSGSRRRLFPDDRTARSDRQ